MKTGKTTRSADTMRAFAVLAIALAKGADTQQPSTANSHAIKHATHRAIPIQIN